MKMSDYVETDIGEFPKDWDVRKLKDVIIKAKSGGTPRRNVPEYWNGNIPFAKVQDITKSGKYLYNTEEFITEKGLENSNAWIVPKDSLLLTIYGSLGFVAINKIPVATNQAIVGIIPNKNIIDTEFLYYWYLYFKPYWSKFIKKGTQPNLTLEIVLNSSVPIPPLEEQKKIVELLQKVDELIIRFNDFLQNLEDEANTLYKSILRLALTGKLTEDWRRQIILLRSVVIPYLVYQASKIKGRPVYMTELMKYLFLLQKEYNINLAYNFEPYKYGPFTPQLYKDLEELKDRIEVKEVKDNVDKSLIISKELPQVNQDIANAVNDLINRFGNKDLKELLSYVYKKYPEYTVKSELNLDEFLE